MAGISFCRPPKLHFLIGVFLSILLVQSRAVSQLPVATILGVVKDSSGAVVPEATITAKNLETGLTRTAASAADGSYRVPALPVGVYELQVEHPGFRTEVRSGLTLAVTQEAVLNFALQVGAVEQTVSVTAEAPLVNTTSGSLGGLVDERRVAELPLNGRNFMDLTLMLPGVTQQRNLGVASSTVGVWFSSNGAPLRSNNYLLDGAIMTNLTNGTSASQDGSTLGIDGIREYRVITNSFSAEYGMTMGSQVMVVTKGGTNTLHGSAFEYLRNSALDARNFFDRKPTINGVEDPNARRLPPFTRNQFGGALGGPIQKDKIFFFGVYEGLRQRLGTTNVNTTIPAACHVTTNNPCITQPTADNPNRNVVPVAQPLLDLFPLPNLLNNQFTFPFAQPIKDDYWQAREDQVFSSADSLFVRYTWNDTTQTDPLNYPQFRTVRFSRSHFATLSENHIFSPTLLSTFRFSMSRTHPRSPSPSGIIGPQYSFVPGQEIGTMNIGGVTSMGPNVAPIDVSQNIFTWSDDFFYTRGRHALKFGTLLNRYRQYIFGPVNAVGSATFANVNNFLQGLTSQYSALTPGSVIERIYHHNTLGFYVQDDFRILPRLTFNIGLRYEFLTVPYEVRGHQAALRDIQHDPAGTPGPIFQNMSLRNFSPRFGFAWDVTGDGKTALRGGFAELYDIGAWGVGLVIASQATPPLSSFSSVGTPSTLAVPLFFPQKGNTLRLMDYRLQQPHILDYNLTLERQLPGRIGLTVGYAGSRGINLMQEKEGNPTVPQILPDGRKFYCLVSVATAPPCPLASPLPPRTNPNWGAMDLHTAAGNSWYNSLQIGLSKQLSHGLQFQSSYTWSKLLDETQGQAGADSAVSNIFGMDPSNRRADRGRADFDLRQNWRFNAIYQLPQPFTGRALRALLNGWRASGILAVQPGSPFTPSLRTNWSHSGVNSGQPGTTAGNFDRPNLAPGRTLSSVTHGKTPADCLLSNDVIPAGTPLGTPNLWLDPCAFSRPDQGTLGTLGRNILTGPGLTNLDFSLVKNMPLRKLGESGALEFRAEFFNILNHPNFPFSDTVRQIFGGAAVFGPTPETRDNLDRLAAAGVITTAQTYPPKSRQIQFALKLLF